MAAGYFWSILAMMSAPFIVLTLIVGLIVRGVRRANRAHAGESSP